MGNDMVISIKSEQLLYADNSALIVFRI